MADQFSREERSRIMRQIRSKNTGLEKKLRSALHSAGLRYRLHPNLPGHPDIVFVSARVLIFIDSCFWHGCRMHGTMPASNRKFWENKINRTKQRDKKYKRFYRNSEWLAIRIWEHDIRKDLNSCVAV